MATAEAKIDTASAGMSEKPRPQVQVTATCLTLLLLQLLAQEIPAGGFLLLLEPLFFLLPSPALAINSLKHFPTEL